MGNNTKERYEEIIRNEDNKILFNKFYYYFNDNDPNDQFNSKEKKFNNPHNNLKISSLNKSSNSFNSNYNSNSSKNNSNTNNNSKEKILWERATLYNNKKKFSKMKISSASTTNTSNSLNRHYRHVSSNNSTSNSTNNSNSNQVINQLKGKRTNSLLNFK